MLADGQRTEAYRQAIAEVVRPGDVVLDLGTGTGVLACFACRAGAARVHAIEAGPILDVARGVCRAAGYQDRVVFYNDVSPRVALPEPVDVIVTETIGNVGLDEGILGSVIDARDRFLRPGGRIVPRRLQLAAVPVEHPEVYRRLDAWASGWYDLDFSPVRRKAVNLVHWCELTPGMVLAEAAPIVDVDLPAVATAAVTGEATFTATRAGTLHGFGVWFGAELTATVGLTTALPLVPRSWQHGLLPLEQPVAVRTGDVIDLIVAVGGNGDLWRWRGVCRRPLASAEAYQTLAVFDQSNFHGLLVGADALHRRASNYVPTLAEPGLADRFILGAMDGRRTTAEIAEDARAAFPDLFRRPDEALERVRDLAQRYGR
jgi:hypothetical protein